MTASCNTITISIHALRKESDNDGIGGAFASPISIHALRKESDLSGKISSIQQENSKILIC